MFAIRGNGYPLGLAPHRDSGHHHVAGRVDHRDSARADATKTITIHTIGSFVAQKDGSFAFKGVIDGVSLEALIKPTSTLRYAFQAKATGANLSGTTNTVYATLIIGGDSGATSVMAKISH